MKRNNYFDNMKAFLIFLVVLGHMTSGFFGDGSGGKGTLYLWIFSFHMPVFIFASGYFASTDTKKTLSRLLPLYLVFQILQIVIRYAYAYSLDPQTARFEFQLFKPEWTLWYLMALILYSLILPVLDTDQRKGQIRNVILSIVAGLVIGFTPYTDNFLAISRMVTFLPFFLLGYYGKKNQGVVATFAGLRGCDKNRMYLCRIIGLAGAVALTVTIVFTAGMFNSRWFFGTLSYGDSFTIGTKILTYLISFAWLLIIMFLTPAKRIPVVEKIGQNTLGIYLFHTAAVSIFKVIPPINDLLTGNTAAVVAASVIVVLILGQDPFTKVLRRLQIPYTKMKKG